MQRKPSIVRRISSSAITAVSRMASFRGASNKNVRVVIVGLNNSGKSTVLGFLSGTLETAEVLPTVAVTESEFVRHGIRFNAVDTSGQSRYRELWEKYYDQTEGIIFVVDSTDEIRLCVALDELRMLLDHPDIKRTQAPLLVFANKMDLDGAITPQECLRDLNLQGISDRAWHISACNAKTGEGVEEGIEWIASKLSANS